MIKPEDVTPELAMALLGWTSIVPRQARQKVADMANSMIEAGLVSPPVWVLRSRTGLLVRELYFNDDQAKTYASPGDTIEHWKGQTS